MMVFLKKNARIKISIARAFCVWRGGVCLVIRFNLDVY